MPTPLKRCPWPGNDPLYLAYHDHEWGNPERNSEALFEKLILDGFQAGLSWITILRKRENFRKAFGGFHPQTMARWNGDRVEKLMANSGIVRNRAKIEGSIKGARAYMKLKERGDDFSSFLWKFIDGQPRIHHRKSGKIPVDSAESHSMSRALKTEGFSFVGPTICYAFMQAVGMVNDHLVTCYRHPHNLVTDLPKQS